MSEQATVGGRRGYWFPLVLLGFGLLGLLGWDSFGRDTMPPGHGVSGYPPDGTGYVGTDRYAETEPRAYLTAAARFEQGPFAMRDEPWAALVTATLVATAGWYGWRARRAGGSVRPYVTVAAGGGTAVLTGYVAVGIADAVADSAGLVTSVGLPLLGLGALAGAWSYLRLGPWRRAVAMAGACCLVVGVGTVLGEWAPGLFAPVIITGGLLVLAGFERSRLLATVAVAASGAMVAFPAGTPSMLVPAAVLLAGGIMALVRQNRTAEPA